MKKRNYTKKQMILIVVLSAAMLFLAAFLNHYFPLDAKPAAGDVVTAGGDGQPDCGNGNSHTCHTGTDSGSYREDRYLFAGA